MFNHHFFGGEVSVRLRFQLWTVMKLPTSCSVWQSFVSLFRRPAQSWRPSSESPTGRRWWWWLTLRSAAWWSLWPRVSLWYRRRGGSSRVLVSVTAEPVTLLPLVLSSQDPKPVFVALVTHENCTHTKQDSFLKWFKILRLSYLGMKLTRFSHKSAGGLESLSSLKDWPMYSILSLIWICFLSPRDKSDESENVLAPCLVSTRGYPVIIYIYPSLKF